MKLRNLIKVGVLLVIGRRLVLSYIDPNTGGMLFQVLAVLFGLLSGLLFFFSGRIKMLIAKFKRSNHEEFETEPEMDLSDWEDNSGDAQP